MVAHTMKMHDDAPATTAPALSEDQFQILVDLLTPVHELAMVQLDMIAEMKASKTPEPIEPIKTSDDPA